MTRTEIERYLMSQVAAHISLAYQAAKLLDTEVPDLYPTLRERIGRIDSLISSYQLKEAPKE